LNFINETGPDIQKTRWFLLFQVLKMYAWELSFQDKVMSIRNREIKRLKQVAYLQGISTFCWLLAPFLVWLLSSRVYF